MLILMFYYIFGIPFALIGDIILYVMKQDLDWLICKQSQCFICD